MARIAFILLCHKDPQAVVEQAQRLTAAGDCMAIHFDASASPKAFEVIKAALGDNPNVVFAKKRIKCGWGEWSLVDATLQAVSAAVDAFPRATHFYMLSGDCMSIKSANYTHEVLDRDDVDHIESFDFFDTDWIKAGMKEDRLIYRHYFNERQQKWRFYTSYALQQKLGLQREIPADLQIMIGSQWWCLRRRTVEAILDFAATRRDVMRFFKTTWIPDETFFQTLVAHLVPRAEIRTRPLTFLLFTDYGMPVTFHNDHYDLLLSQDFLFARKISPDAVELKSRLGALYASDQGDFSTSNEGRTLFRFLASRGRVGQRYGPTIWNKDKSLGDERQLLVITCKKWHVAKRLLARIKDETDIRALEYAYDEKATELPDMGGIQTTLKKRNSHQMAFTKLLFDCAGTNRLVVCMDPSNFDLLSEIFAQGARTRLLEIVCNFDEDYLVGHAMRVGLAGDTTPPETIARLLPTLKHAFSDESQKIRDGKFPAHLQLAEASERSENALALSEFLDVAPETAEAILSIDHLFSD